MFFGSTFDFTRKLSPTNFPFVPQDLDQKLDQIWIPSCKIEIQDNGWNWINWINQIQALYCSLLLLGLITMTWAASESWSSNRCVWCNRWNDVAAQHRSEYEQIHHRHFHNQDRRSLHNNSIVSLVTTLQLSLSSRSSNSSPLLLLECSLLGINQSLELIKLGLNHYQPPLHENIYFGKGRTKIKYFFK